MPTRHLLASLLALAWGLWSLFSTGLGAALAPMLAKMPGLDHPAIQLGQYVYLPGQLGMIVGALGILAVRAWGRRVLRWSCLWILALQAILTAWMVIAPSAAVSDALGLRGMVLAAGMGFVFSAALYGTLIALIADPKIEAAANSAGL